MFSFSLLFDLNFLHLAPGGSVDLTAALENGPDPDEIGAFLKAAEVNAGVFLMNVSFAKTFGE